MLLTRVESVLVVQMSP